MGKSIELETQENFILVPFGNSFLALTRNDLTKATQLGNEIVGRESINTKGDNSSRETLVDAEGMKEKTGIPSTWFLEAARQGRIPYIKAGKYVRFRLEEVIKVLQGRNGHKARRNFSRK